jgi:hypothetical protein
MVEPFEFASNGGGGVALLRLIKRLEATFYEVMLFALTHYGDYSILRA